MLLNAAHIVIGLVLLAVGAECLVRGASGLALRLGVTALAIGLTVVAFGTGSPELAISIGAARAGNSGLALGNVVGSNISNIALVLGCAALVRPLHVRSELIRREVPLVIAATLLLWIMLSDGTLSRIEGIALVTTAVVYTVSSYAVSKRAAGRVVAEEFDEAISVPKRPAWQDVLLVIAGLSTLLVGANFLLGAAVKVASALGVSQVVIGLTIVAVGTNLPELATSITSSLRDEPDVAFGNVLGSNVLNITAVLGAAALIRPFTVTGLRPVDLFVLVGTAVVLLPLLWRGAILNRWEGSALLVGYALYIWSLAP